MQRTRVRAPRTNTPAPNDDVDAELIGAYERMVDEAMETSFTGSADQDFARFVIPHHQGIIAMAKVHLRHGADLRLRLIAQAIIDAQTARIEELRDWLDEHAE